MRRSALSLLIAAALSACAHGVPKEADTAERLQPAPASWSRSTATTSASAEVLSTWWTQFDDPLLGELIHDALRANPDLLQARATLAQARALRSQTAASRSPQIGTSASVTRSRKQQVSTNTWSAGLDASWEADFFGALSSATRARDADVAAATADLATVQRSLSAEVATAYLQLRGARQTLRIAQDNLTAQQETATLIGWRVKAGLASSLDEEQAKLSVEQLRATLPTQEATIAVAEHQLGVLLGLSPNALQERLGTSERVPQVTSELPLALPAEVLRQRPDVRAAESRIQAEALRLQGKRAERLPTFAVNGSLALQAATAAALNGPGALVSAAAAAVDWPLWDGGSRKSQVEAQQAVLEQARQTYRSTVLTALQDVEDALTYLGSTQTRLVNLERADESARNALLLARHRYQAGLIDFTTLLDSQRSALTAQSSLATARTDLGLYRVRLYKALGGGWSPSAS